MTRSEVRALARKKLGETIGAFWTDIEMNSWINEAGEDIAFKTKSIRTDGYMTTVLDTSDYSLATYFPNFYSALDVYFYREGTQWIRLKPLMDRTELDLEFPGWMSADSTVPAYYVVSREEDKLQLYPAPNATNAGTDYLRMYYARTFTVLSTSSTADTSTPSLPEPLHLAMVDWVVATGLETRGYGDKANDAWSKYAQKLQAYHVIRHAEKEDDSLIMRPYRSS